MYVSWSTRTLNIRNTPTARIDFATMRWRLNFKAQSSWLRGGSRASAPSRQCLRLVQIIVITAHWWTTQIYASAFNFFILYIYLHIYRLSGGLSDSKCCNKVHALTFIQWFYVWWTLRPGILYQRFRSQVVMPYRCEGVSWVCRVCASVVVSVHNIGVYKWVISWNQSNWYCTFYAILKCMPCTLEANMWQNNMSK